jgi:hypothetical protein
VRRVARLVGLCVLVAAGLTGAASAGVRQPFLALTGNGVTETLVRLHPISLEPVPGRRQVYVGLHDIPHAFSPGGSLLAIGSGRTSSLLIVDVRHMRIVGHLDARFTNAVSWLSPRRLVLVENVRAEGTMRASVLAVDRGQVRVLARFQLTETSNLNAIAPGRHSAALLLSPQGELGRAQLAVVDSTGIRYLTLDRIAAGSTPSDPAASPQFVRYSYPGLAVDPAGDRAFVVAPDGVVAEVSLSSLAVTYNELSTSRQAEAAADGGGSTVFGDGSTRNAAWLGRDLIAVSGDDQWTEMTPAGPVQHFATAGLRLIDTATWSERTLDEHAEWFAATGRFLVGVSSEPRRLTAYDRAGDVLSRRSLRAYGIQVGGGRAYLTLGEEYRRHRVRVVDLGTGRVLRTVWVPGWFYPLNRRSPERCWC